LECFHSLSFSLERENKGLQSTWKRSRPRVYSLKPLLRTHVPNPVEER